MADRSAIEWTDATWNPITGCSVVSPGCTNCYAMRLAGTRLRHHRSRAGLTTETKAGPVWTGEVRLNEEWLDQPLRWRRQRMIFVCAHGDLFHPGVSVPWLDRIFARIALADWHILQVLTKRIGRAWDYLGDPMTPARIAMAMASVTARGSLADMARGRAIVGGFESGELWPLHNVWLGVSVEDQMRADERRSDLAALAAAGWTTFVSYEPALGPVDWSGWEFLRWLISGGENGPRPSHPDWHRAARDFGARHDIPFLFKQWGTWGPGAQFEADPSARNAYRGEILTLRVEGSREIKLAIPTRDDDELGPPLTLEQYGKKAAGRLLDGVEHGAMPDFGGARAS